MNWKAYVRTWWWEEATYDCVNLDGEQVELFGQEAVRAFLPVWVCRAALPVPELKTLYEERWPSWEEESPKWFTPAFEERVYDELAPPQVLAARIEARAEVEAERTGILSRAFSRGPSRTLSRALSTSRVSSENTSTTTSMASAMASSASGSPAVVSHLSGVGVEEGSSTVLQPGSGLELESESGEASTPLEAWS